MNEKKPSRAGKLVRSVLKELPFFIFYYLVVFLLLENFDNQKGKKIAILKDTVSIQNEIIDKQRRIIENQNEVIKLLKELRNESKREAK